MDIEFLFTKEFLFGIANKAIRVGIIIGCAYGILIFGNKIIDRFFNLKRGTDSVWFEEKRAKTLTEILKTFLRYSIYFFGFLFVLSEFNVNTTSLIAGAGVIGLAFGMGAQNLIKDFIAGFFIIMEDQYAMGDYVMLDTLAGTVEEVGFRVTKLRDFNGVLHIIPNGSIVRVSNHTRGPMQALVNVIVSHNNDMDKVISLMTEACEKIKEMPEIIEAPKVVGIVDLKGHEVVIRVVAKTIPLERIKIETALRKEIKQLFDANNINMPTYNMPQVSV